MVGFAFLQCSIQIDINRSFGRGLCDLLTSEDGLNGRWYRAGLVVPFGVVPHQSALVSAGVYPVNPGSAFGRIPGACGTQNQHGRAVTPCIENGHGGMHQANVGVHHRAHHGAADFGIALCQRDGHLLVQAQQHLRMFVAQVIDQAVVQAAVTRPRIQGQIGQSQTSQALGNRVTSPDIWADLTGDGDLAVCHKFTLQKAGGGVGWWHFIKAQVSRL